MSRACGVAVLVVLGWCLAWPAHADDGDAAARARALVAEGVAEGRAGRLEEALARLREGAALDPRARYLCNVGLAYARLAQPARAFVYLDRCRQGWAAEESEPLPAWVEARMAEQAETLQARDHVLVRMEVEGPAARIRPPGFAADELFDAPVETWLPAAIAGASVELVRADGTRESYALTATQLEARDGRRRIVLPGPVAGTGLPATDDGAMASVPLVDTSPPIARAADGPAEPTAGPGLRLAGWGAIGLGGAAVIASVLTGSAAADARREASRHARDTPEYAGARERFTRYRNVTYGLYATAAIGVGAGVVLLLVSRDDAAPRVAAWPVAGGGTLAVSWEM